MKIRHKQSGVELEGKFAEFSQGSICGKPRNFWIEPNNAASQYSCDDWEAVPEWVDVTWECGLANLPESCVIVHNFMEIDVRSGYRLRKVSAVTLYPEGKAFIVERKA